MESFIHFGRACRECAHHDYAAPQHPVSGRLVVVLGVSPPIRVREQILQACARVPLDEAFVCLGDCIQAPLHGRALALLNARDLRALAVLSFESELALQVLLHRFR